MKQNPDPEMQRRQLSRILRHVRYCVAGLLEVIDECESSQWDWREIAAMLGSAIESATFAKDIAANTIVALDERK